jgi:general secretion pathway protein L
LYRIMLAELFSWWTEQMRDLAAPLTRRASANSRDALVLARDPGVNEAWRILRRRNGATTQLATLSADAGDAAWRNAFAPRRRGEPVVIALGQPFLLRRTTLPLAAAANLEPVLRYEMDRLTPFAAPDVLFSHRVLSRDATAGTLLVEVAVVPRAWAREPMERLAALAIRPEALEQSRAPFQPDGSPGGEAPIGQPPRRIPLDHVDPAQRARARLAWRVAVGACAALAAAVIAVPFIRQSLALADVDDQIEQLRPRMAQVDALRKQIAAGSAGAGQIAAARQRQAIVLRVLGELTDLMPDDTFLTSIAFRKAHLTIEGHSTAATKLIATMAADPQLTNPAFAAPVVRADNGKDIFTIQAGFGS